jgi:D-alanyl-D-alanine carboxypeptidase
MFKAVKVLTTLLLFLIPMQSLVIPAGELLGRVDPSSHEDFVRIEQQYTSKSGIFMRKEAYSAFLQMHKAAKEEGIQLKIISATRNFDYQKGIWERKWQKTKYMGWKEIDKVRDIMKYSAMPGTSRHHWGTDIDLNALENDYFESGQGKAIYDWLTTHATEFGFAQTYTSKDSGRTGYNEEKWHWSYMPLSRQYLAQYKEEVNYNEIKGFSGAEHAPVVRAIEDYVYGIATGE